jgi:hypothetical protein
MPVGREILVCEDHSPCRESHKFTSDSRVDERLPRSGGENG